MGNKKYIEKLQMAIHQQHGLESKHVASFHVTEKLPGKVVWDGEVELFEIFNCPQTQWCYAWISRGETEEKSTIVLQVPPVISPGTAVRVSVMAERER